MSVVNRDDDMMSADSPCQIGASESEGLSEASESNLQLMMAVN